MSHHYRAFATLEIKSVDDEAREIRGVATTPSMDAVGDIVEPTGATYALPLPLLWQHDQRQPIGQVVQASVTAAGIEIVARIAKLTEPGQLKARIDEAWQSVRAGLVRGLSIGFIGTGEPIRGGGTRYKAWRLLELSVVTIPANADCSIVAVKSAFARADRARAQQKGGLPVIRLDSNAGGRRPGVIYLNEPGARKGVVYLDADDRQRAGRTGVVYLKR